MPKGYSNTPEETIKKKSESASRRLPFTEITRKKLSDAQKGRKDSIERRENNRNAQRIAQNRLEVKEKKSKSIKATMNKIDYKERRRKIAKEIESRPEVREKQSIATIDQWKSKSFRERMSGINHPNWINGISFEPYGLEFNNNLKKNIREKFNYVCILCNKTEEENKRKLTPHHIDYNKKNNLEDNFVLLCNSCHPKTNFNRDLYEIFFKRFKQLSKGETK